MNTLPFTGRAREQRKLQLLLSRPNASLVVVKGRRRIGKSRLIEEFIKDLPAYSFKGLFPTSGSTAQTQRNEFARQLSEQSEFSNIQSNDWGDLFTLLAKLTNKGRVVIVLDEISWMGSKDPDFLGKLNIAWETHFKHNSELILILCGSISSWIEKNILSSTGFFGRVATTIHLESMRIPSCDQLLNNAGFAGSAIDKLNLLSVTGGIPWYLELVNPALSTMENIHELCFSKDGILVDEYNRVFHDLFGKRGDIYQAVVSTLTNGHRTYTEISDKLAYASGGPLSDYLEELKLSNYISRDYSWDIKNQRENKISKYRLRDNYLRFYLKYIAPRLNRIQQGRFDEIDLLSLPGIETIFGLQLENLVLENRELIIQQSGLSNSEVVLDNPYYQTATKQRQGCQIDYLIQTPYNTLYAYEIKFHKHPIGISVVSDMQEKIRRLNLPKGYAVVPCLIHVNGLSSELQDSNYFKKTINLCDFFSD